jgi:hypothetical protein
MSNIGKEYEYKDFWLRVRIQGEELFNWNETFKMFEQDGKQYVRIIEREYVENHIPKTSNLCKEVLVVK